MRNALLRTYARGDGTKGTVAMSERRAVEVGAVMWAAVGLCVGVLLARGWNADARAFAYSASIVGPAASIGAAFAVSRERDHLAGTLLVLSGLITPTVFAYVLNIPA